MKTVCFMFKWWAVQIVGFISKLWAGQNELY